MKKYSTENIRNLAIVGHSGCGKTTFTEACLFKTGAISKMGKVEEKNTVSDYTPEEMNRGVSIAVSIIPIEWNNIKINLIDTPGYFDFEDEVYNALRASEAALVVIDASSGIEVGTEKVLNYTEKIELPRIIFINKIEKENVNFSKVISDLRVAYGKKVIPFTLTLGEGESFKGIIDVLNKKAYEYDKGNKKEVAIPENRVEEVDVVYHEIIEAVAETDDDLMEKYFAGEEFTHEELMKGVTSALLNGTAVPVVAGSSYTGAGINMLLDVIRDYMPAPNDERAKSGFRIMDKSADRKVDINEPYSAVIFKTVTDSFVGKISLFKVISGKITKNTEIYNISKNKSEKFGNIFYLRGKTQIETDEVVAGDIGAISKLQETETGDTLCDKSAPILYRPLKSHEATLYFAIEPKTKGDEEKITQALQKLQDEYAGFTVTRNSETKQLLIGGQGNVQLEIIIEKLKNSFGVETVKIGRAHV